MTMDWSFEAKSLWAKTGEEESWLNLPRHMMDSAAVGEVLWTDWLAPGLRKRLEHNLNLQGDGVPFASWLTGVHDVGKCTPMFQGQLRQRIGLERHIHRVLDAGLPLRDTTTHDWYPHSTGSEIIIQRWLAEHLDNVSRRYTNHLAAIAGAHHGLPSGPGFDRACKAEFQQMDPVWRTVQDELMERLIEYSASYEVLPRVLRQRISRTDQMVLTGLVIMADWLASNQDYFPLSVADAESSRHRAEHALRQLALTMPLEWPDLPDSAHEVFAKRFHWPTGRTARPAQAETLRTAHELNGPGLICLEAPMGAGKTEAALAAAEVMASQTGRGGVMFAAPTMATSDALLSRVKGWADSIVTTDSGQVTSLFLGHSKQGLNEEMQQLRRAASGIQNIDEDDATKAGEVVAHQWLSGRKLGMLANIVVGTVDQVLFLALQAKHAMLRHLGLAGKVVVIDEVHAYDTYMNAYLARALEWLGAYGVPIVLLSATLPHTTKARLIAAYASGLQRANVSADEIDASGTNYPVITAADRHGVRTITTEAPPTQYHASMNLLDDDLESLAEIMHRVRDEGGALLVLCNTVGRAQEAYALAQDIVGDDSRLLHSRFIAIDRVDLERELVAELGPPSEDVVRPHRRIVVATQVIEQSLDLDFDAIITDIAPMDLVLQRLGRVHRHQRPASDRPAWAEQPQLWIRGIEDPGSDTTPPEFGYAQELIYARAILLKTWAMLRQRMVGDGMEIPQDIPQLVHAVYGDKAPIPAAWNQTLNEAQAELEAQQLDAANRAKSFMFPPPRSSPTMRGLWKDQTRDVGQNEVSEAQGFAQVRDTDPTLEVIVTQHASGGYRILPWLDESDTVLTAESNIDERQAYTLASCSLRLPHSFSYPEVFDQALDELEEHTDAGWHHSYVLKGQLQLMVDEDLRCVLAGKALRYDRTLGLIEEIADEPKEHD
ncbi:CRISPR-associated helicase Cas3' [Yaniella flava]|uniref:CRISPR-associated helicase Cas3 n=1 Tax=Yaniella flava TaxID=287930 RepID=A0ABP5GJQ5_9MICC